VKCTLHLAAGRNIGQGQVGLSALQALDERVDATAGFVIRFEHYPVAYATWLAGDMGVRDHGNGLVDVVEDHHAVIEAEAEVGQAAVVDRGMLESLDVADGVVAREADRAAQEARQPQEMGRSKAGQGFLEQAQGVVVRQLQDCAGNTVLDADR